MINLSITLLRTFVTVIDLGSFTKAGELLGKTQPAISLQIRRLETAMGTKLIDSAGASPKPTEDGEVLSSFARRILLLNDETVSFYNEPKLSKVIRIGLPTDYAVSFLQSILVKFKKEHEDVNFNIRCALSVDLLEDFRKDNLDIIIAMTTDKLVEFLSRSWISRPIWVASKKKIISIDEPIPLITHPEGCEYRQRMIESLNTHHLKWKVMYCSPGISGIQNAVESGLGVSALTQPTLTKKMRVLTEEDGFPPLTNLMVGLYCKHLQQNHAGHLLVNYIAKSFDEAAAQEFKRKH